MTSWSRSVDFVGGFAGPVLVLSVALLAGAIGAGSATSLRVPSGEVRFLAGFSVEISAIPVADEPGLPAVFFAAPHGGVPPFFYEWADSRGGSGNGANHSLVPLEVGNESATVTVTDAAGSLAAATFVEPVVAGIDVQVSATNATDVGLPFSVIVSVAGGIPPYRIDVTIPGGTGTNETVAAPGSYAVPVAAPTAGWVTATTVVTDQIGGVGSESARVADLAESPQLTVVDAPAAFEVGPTYAWWLGLAGGTAPLAWSVSTVGAVENVSGTNGTATAPSAIRWSAGFNESGNATLRFGGVDAAGSNFSLWLPIHVAAPLAVRATAIAGNADRPSVVNVSVEAGVPPYEVELSGPGGPFSLENASVAGVFGWTLDGSFAESGNLSLRVTDAAGGAVAVVLAAPTIPASPSHPSPDDTSWELPVAIAFAGVALAGAVVAVRYRPRRRDASTPPAPVVPAIEAVEQILTESDAIERETLYLLGEDRGQSRAAIEAGISHWTHLGRVETVRGVGGEELLRWSDATTTPPPERR
ncbi:MAG: hypothetical protein L3K06_02640 [Thermoplasmata archaeon]|nr:hypothetical protein [Thermoplasmata archaeon]